MNNHPRLSLPVRRPVAVTMVVLAVVVFGYISYQRLSLNLMPDITYPTLTVRTEYPGNAPEEVELAISRPLEETLGVVNNLVTISSISRNGISDIIIEYDWDTDMNLAIQDIREKLDQVFLPEDAERPIILRYDPSLDPILRIGISGSDNLFFLRRLAEDEFKRDLEQMPGIAAVKVKGGYDDEILVEVDQGALDRLNISIESINQSLSGENINIAGGDLKEGDTEYTVRILNQFRTIDEIGEIVVATRNKAEIHLKDIGTVSRAPKELEVISRVNGKLAAEIEIYKEADANIVETAKNVINKVFGTPAQQAYVAEFKAKQEAQKKAEPDSTAKKKVEKEKGKKEAHGGQGGPGAGIRHQIMTNFMEYNLPAGLELNILSDQSVFIEKSIAEVRTTAIMGGILAIVVLFFFLRNTLSTIIVGIAIPISVIATFAPMHIFKVSLNIMSLGGIALGIGMLVDNSIVVLESIFRCREEGDDIVKSAVRGTQEVRSAVAASTLTTIAVFFPIVFVKGVAGQIFGNLALAVVFSLLASLGVAVYLIPMLVSRNLAGKYSGLKPPGIAELKKFTFWKSFTAGIKWSWNIAVKGNLIWRSFKILLLLPLFFIYHLIKFLIEFILNISSKLLMIVLGLTAIILKYAVKYLGLILGFIFRPLLNAFDASFAWLNRLYPRVIRGALDKKWQVLISAFALFAFCYFVLVPQIGRELIPQVHQGEFNLEFTLPVGTPIEKTAERISPVEYIAGASDQTRIVSAVYGTEKTSIKSAEEGENFGRITLLMTPGGDLKQREEVLIEDLRRKIADIPEVEINVTRPALFTFKTPIEIEIQGYNLDDLKKVSDKTVTLIETIPGIRDVRSNIQRGNPEVQLRYKRDKLAALGLNIYQVASIVRNKVKGEVTTQFHEEDRKIDIRVRLAEKDRASLQDISRIVVNPEGKIPIFLSSIADIRLDEGPSEIRRINGQRAALISANVEGRDLGSVTEEIYRTLSSMDMPSEFSFLISGQNREMQTSLQSLMFALALAVFLVYIVMASQFESLIHPLVIMFTIPLALIGVFIVLYFMHLAFSVVVFLGLIMLAGIVVNNAIVLVDYVNQLRARGLPKREALVEAGKIRLRPILMTTTTTVLGLLPMALGLGEGAEIRTPMAITVIAGLISSTFLTLIVIPTVYSILTPDDK